MASRMNRNRNRIDWQGIACGAFLAIAGIAFFALIAANIILQAQAPHFV